MAQIGYAPMGYQASIDQSAIDYRGFFPLGSEPWGSSGYANSVTFADAFAFFWKIRSILIDWSYSFGGGGGDAGTVVISPVDPGSSFGGTERKLVCSRRSNEFFAVAPFDLSWALEAYDVDAKTFGYNFFIQGPPLSFDPAMGWPDSGIVFDFLGYTATLYGDPAFAPYSGHFTITADTWWTYTDSGGIPGFDGGTGQQLRTPAPTTLF